MKTIDEESMKMISLETSYFTKTQKFLSWLFLNWRNIHIEEFLGWDENYLSDHVVAGSSIGELQLIIINPTEDYRSLVAQLAIFRSDGECAVCILHRLSLPSVTILSRNDKWDAYDIIIQGYKDLNPLPAVIHDLIDQYEEWISNRMSEKDHFLIDKSSLLGFETAMRWWFSNITGDDIQHQFGEVIRSAVFRTGHGCPPPSVGATGKNNLVLFHITDVPTTRSIGDVTIHQYPESGSDTMKIIIDDYCRFDPIVIEIKNREITITNPYGSTTGDGWSPVAKCAMDVIRTISENPNFSLPAGKNDAWTWYDELNGGSER